ncbi:MAG: pyridoxal kinase [Hyphomicrobiaceae bacterium]|nr:pyridoxal kinase [Hyphomicrobiaceae bacterium]
MARVLAISSQVARGHVGLSAMVPALQRLGHEVWPLPSILLSNHPGHAHVAGLPIAPAALEEMADALDRNGWLSEIDAVVTGYLPSREHVRLAARIVRRLRRGRAVLYLCDPVLGDEPKGLYLDPDAASAIRGELVPLADVITPNRFELGWLRGRPAHSLEDQQEAARALTGGAVLVTSAARRGEMIDNVLLESSGIRRCAVLRRPDVPHGTGDFLAALFLGHRLRGETASTALARAAAGVEQAILASHGRDELALVASQDAWPDAAPLEVQAVDAGG